MFFRLFLCFHFAFASGEWICTCYLPHRWKLLQNRQIDERAREIFPHFRFGFFFFLSIFSIHSVAFHSSMAKLKCIRARTFIRSNIKHTKQSLPMIESNIKQLYNTLFRVSLQFIIRIIVAGWWQAVGAVNRHSSNSLALLRLWIQRHTLNM